MSRFKTALIVGLLAPGGALAEATPRNLDPPLSERTIGALRKACSASRLEHLTHHLVLRRNARHRAAGPFAWDWPEQRRNPTNISDVGAWPFCHLFNNENGLVTWAAGDHRHV